MMVIQLLKRSSGNYVRHCFGGAVASLACEYHTTARHWCAQNADHFATSSPFSAFFIEVVCDLGAIPPRTTAAPPPIGGNCIIRAATRRRYTASQFLMLQNPHRHWCGRHRRDRGARLRCPWAVAVPGWASRRRAEPPIRDPAPLVWRAPEGPEGTGGLRDRPLRAKLACGDLAGGRARRCPEHPWGHKQHHQSGQATRQDTAKGPKRRSASGPSRVSVAHRLSWMLRPGTASISSRV